jgi:hypothetical protein
MTKSNLECTTVLLQRVSLETVKIVDSLPPLGLPESSAVETGTAVL